MAHLRQGMVVCFGIVVWHQPIMAWPPRHICPWQNPIDGEVWLITPSMTGDCVAWPLGHHPSNQRGPRQRSIQVSSRCQALHGAAVLRVSQSLHRGNHSPQPTAFLCGPHYRVPCRKLCTPRHHLLPASLLQPPPFPPSLPSILPPLLPAPHPPHPPLPPQEADCMGSQVQEEAQDT